jgi:hypothetical protein
MVYGLAKLAVDSREVQVNENEVEAGECYALSLFYFIFIFRVIYDGRTMSARAACEARDGTWCRSDHCIICDFSCIL